MRIQIANFIRNCCSPSSRSPLASPAWSQNADTILVNGKILTVDRQFSTREAIAMRDGKITAVGSNADIRKQAGPQTRVIDLQGRTVIPGFIDSHIHAIRAGQTFTTEVNWVGATSIAEAHEPDPRSFAGEKAGLLADRRGRLERGAVQRKAQADAGGPRRGGAEQSRLRAAWLRLGSDDARGLQSDGD